jgi:hypothetical protein
MFILGRASIGGNFNIFKMLVKDYFVHKLASNSLNTKIIFYGLYQKKLLSRLMHPSYTLTFTL